MIDDPRHQFFAREWFGQKIICSEGERVDHQLLAVGRRDPYDWKISIAHLLADMAGELQPTHARHHRIGD